MFHFSKIRRIWHYIIYGIPVCNKNVTMASITYKNPSEILKGRKIVITGASKGIGYAMAKKFISEGAEVLISGRDEKKLKKVSSELGCKHLVLDVTNPECFEKFLSESEKELGGDIDTLVNNAGISMHENSFFDVTVKTFDDQFKTNYRGAFFLTQEFTKSLIKKQLPGNVLFITSETGQSVDYLPYGYTKAAMNSLVQGLAYYFASKNIRINAVAPGITATEMTNVGIDGDLYIDRSTIKRAYLPEEVAEVACFIISDIAGCISGQIIYSNNGKSINARWKKL